MPRPKRGRKDREFPHKYSMVCMSVLFHFEEEVSSDKFPAQSFCNLFCRTRNMHCVMRLQRTAAVSLTRLARRNPGVLV